MTVLLVDDSPIMRRYVARTLQMTGLETTIHEAENGREGIERALDLVPDLVITDLNMPEMSGVELIEKMHASTQLRRIPVMVLTADRSPARPAEVLGCGASTYLTKPVTPQTLRRELLALLEAIQ